MRFLLVAAALALTPASVSAQQTPQPTIADLSQQARAAREAGDAAGFLKAIEGLQALLPWSPTVQFNMARAYAANGRKAEALAMVTSLANAGWGFEALDDALFASLKGDPTFQAVGERLAANRRPQGRVGPSRKLGLVGKQPEGVVTTADGTIYVGTIRGGIHRVDANGLRPLYTPGGGWGIAGLRFDAPRRELIACVVDEAAGKSRLVRLGLPDLAERAAADLPASGTLCNDSTVLPDGRVALTDSTGGRLWIADRTKMVEVKTDRPLFYPNGTAYHDGKLYVAHAGGLRTVDPGTGQSRDVAADGTLLIGIDGLIAHEGRLLAVQNGVQPIRILRLTPDGTGKAQVEILAAGHDVLAGATTAAVIGDKLLVLTQTGIPNGSQPDDPMLVEVPLSR